MNATATYQFRTTFQLGKDKFGASTDIQRHYRDQAFGQLDQGIARIEANAAMCHNDSLTQFTWSRPQSNTLLFEGGGSVSLNAFGTANFGTALDGSDYEECGQSQPFRVNIADAARGANYHGVGAIGIGMSNLFVGRFATSLVVRRPQLQDRLQPHPRQRHRQYHQPRRRRRQSADLLHLHQRRADRR